MMNEIDVLGYMLYEDNHLERQLNCEDSLDKTKRWDALTGQQYDEDVQSRGFDSNIDLDIQSDSITGQILESCIGRAAL